MKENPQQDDTFLALTALEEFWDKSKKIIFLGEWCRPFCKRNNEALSNAQLLEHPGLEESNSQSAYDYTIRIYEELLPKLANWLNQVHGLDRSLRYWSIIIGPFLLFYIQAIYFRLIHLKVACSLYPNLQTIGLNQDSYKTPKNTRDFVLLLTENDAWNQQLFTQIINEEFPNLLTNSQNFNWNDATDDNKKVILPSDRLKKTTLFKFIVINVLMRFRINKFVCLASYDFSKKNILKLIRYSMFGISPIFITREFKPQLTNDTNLSIELRKGVESLGSSDRFSRLILKTLKTNLPLNFLENFLNESKFYECLFRSNISAIVSNSWMQSDEHKFWVSKQVEMGTKLVNFQHGGGYGCTKNITSEYLERTIADVFISWGWESDSKVISAPSLLLFEVLSQKKWCDRKIDNRMILWTGNETTRYPVFIQGRSTCMNAYYFNQQKRFRCLLNDCVVEEIVMRIRPESKNKDFLEASLPGIKIHLPSDRGTFYDQLYNAKILISDTGETTFLFGLALNIPTLVFWDPSTLLLRDDAILYFKELEDVGIYHSTPESAAIKLNQIADNPYLWWASESLQDVRKRFCYRFARSGHDSLVVLKDILLSFK